jgi:hypothetical protein
MALAALLIAAAFINPYTEGTTFCLIERAGIDFCPGNGLGRSISLAYRGEFTDSFRMHPVGMAAVLIIMVRITSILRRNVKQYQPTETDS